jgi:hypothetical protein
MFFASLGKSEANIKFQRLFEIKENLYFWRDARVVE